MKLSIITPVYNRADCIARCLESVASQSEGLSDFEHVVVDDGSTDGTRDIVAKFAASHPYVSPIFFDRNKGTNAARNAAIKAAKGDFCVFLDSDDYFLPDAIETILTLIAKRTDYRYFMLTIGYRQEFFDGLYGKDAEIEYRYEDVLSGKMNGDYVHVMPRDVMLKYPFDEKLRIYESLILMQLYRAVGRMLFVNRPAVCVELNRSDSVSLQTVRISDEVIGRQLQASLKELELFGSDYETHGLIDKKEAICVRIVDNALLIGDYGLAGRYIPYVKGKKKVFFTIVSRLHLAPLYKKALQVYLRKKYSYSDVVKS